MLFLVPNSRTANRRQIMNKTRKAIVGAAMLGVTLTGGAAALLGGHGERADRHDCDRDGAAAAQPDSSKGGHTANGITEVLLTGDTATQVSTAAQAAVPGATIDRVETDAEGATYERT